jgi:hypothetical protein
MGQRLVVSVQNNGKELATVYYHWSAYTVSALWEVSKLVRCIFNHEDETEEELKLRLIRFCEENGGGINGNTAEFKYIQDLYPNEVFKRDGYSRNNGLIDLSERGREEAHGWSEGDVEIYIDEERINNGVFGWWSNYAEYCEEVKSWGEDYVDDLVAFEDIPDIGYNLGDIEIEDIDNVITALEAAGEHIVRYGNEIYELVE